MPKDQGTISNRTETDLRTSVSHWLADVWFGNTKEGVTKARRFVNVIENTPGGIPLWANDIANLTKQGDYAGAALTAALGALPAKHLSRHKFDKFDYNKGSMTGEGTQDEGPGTYFMPPASTMENLYKKIFTTVDVKTRGKKGQKLSSEEWLKDIQDFISSIETNKIETDRLVDFSKKYAAKPGKGVYIQNENEARVIDAFDNSFIKKPVKPFKYDVKLNADPERIMQYENSLENQLSIPKKYLTEALADVYNPSKMRSFETSPLTGGGLFETKAGYESDWLGTPVNISMIDRAPITQADFQNYMLDKKLERPVETINEFYGEKARDLYTERALPITRYKDPNTHNKDYYNYVVHNDDIIEILKRTQLGAAPIGLGSLLALEEEKKKPKKDNKNGK